MISGDNQAGYFQTYALHLADPINAPNTQLSGPLLQRHPTAAGNGQQFSRIPVHQLTPLAD